MTRAGRLAFALALALAAVAPRTAAAGAPRPVDGGEGAATSPSLSRDTTVDVRFELDARGPGDGRGDGSARLPDAGASARSPTATRAAMHVVHVTGPGAGQVLRVRRDASAAPVLGRGTVTTAPELDSGAPVRFLVYGDNRSDADRARGASSAPCWRRRRTSSSTRATSSTTAAAPRTGRRSSTSRRRSSATARSSSASATTSSTTTRRAPTSPATSASPTRPAARCSRTARCASGNARFFFLNGMHDWDSRRGARRGSSASSRKADNEPGLVWRIVVVHHGPVVGGPARAATRKLVDAHVPELLAAHKVDLLFSGHDHIYERGERRRLAQVRHLGRRRRAALPRSTHPSPTTRKAEAAYHFVEVTATPDDAAHRRPPPRRQRSLEQVRLREGPGVGLRPPPTRGRGAAGAGPGGAGLRPHDGARRPRRGAAVAVPGATGGRRRRSWLAALPWPRASRRPRPSSGLIAGRRRPVRSPRCASVAARALHPRVAGRSARSACATYPDDLVRGADARSRRASTSARSPSSASSSPTRRASPRPSAPTTRTSAG